MEKQLSAGLSQFLEETTAHHRDQLQGLLRDQLSLQRDQLLQEAAGVDASIFENPRFLEMQEKMQSHFS